MTILITGNTFPVKDQIKALGGKWDPQARGWRVPEAKAKEAQALVDSAPAQKPRTGSSNYKRRGTRTGCSCGSVEEYEKASDCWSCKHDRY